MMLSEYWAAYVDQALIFLVLVVALNILVGYVGVFSIGSAAFAAVGGYVTAYFALHHALSVPVLLLMSVVAGTVIGLVVAWPVMRMSAEYVMLLTMAMSILAVSVVAAIPALGSQQGLLGLPLPVLFGETLLTPTSYLPWLGLLALVVTLVCWRVGESPYGRLLRAIRDDELAAQSLGKRTARAKTATFGLMCGLTALGGALLVLYNGIAAPSLFSLNVTMLVFAMVIVGGVASIPGSVLGTALIVFVEPVLKDTLALEPEVSALVRPVVFGLLLVVVMQFRPQGLVPARHRKVRLPARPAATVRERTAPPERPEYATTGEPAALEVRDLCKSFGGVRAADHLTLSVPTGRITALVGPNGAGKSSLFNLVTGVVPADSGSVLRHGSELLGMRPEEVVRHGVARSFQDVRVFGSLTAVENVMLAVRDHPGERLPRTFLTPRSVRRGDREIAARALDWLEFVGLADHARTQAGALSFAQQKQVTFARALATDAEVLLLDEPLSGVEGSAADDMIGLVERMRGLGRSICLVEHSISTISRLADWAYFMELGRVTAEGRIEDLLADPRLVEAYFGAA